MISVFVSVQENEAALLARTLENLVPYAVEGFVQQVFILHHNLDNTTRVLADEAGCVLVPAEAGFKTACTNARGDWLLFMEPGAQLQTGWAGVVDAHANADGGAAYFKIGVSASSPWWKRLFFPRRFKSPLSRGLLISKRQARANLKDQKTPLDLVRGLALKRLNAEISPA